MYAVESIFSRQISMCSSRFSLLTISFSFFSVDDIDKVLKEMEITNSITDMIIEDNRRRHVTVLVSERGTWAEDRNQNNEG